RSPFRSCQGSCSRSAAVSACHPLELRSRPPGIGCTSRRTSISGSRLEPVSGGLRATTVPPVRLSRTSPMRKTSLSVRPLPENGFFEQTVFDQALSQGFFELARLSLELLDLVRGRLTRRVAGEPFLARLQELLRPTVVQVLIDPFLAAQLSNAVLAT